MKNGVDYDDTVLLEYDGAFASLNFGFDVKSENAATIVGENGLIVMDNWFFCGQNVKLYDKNNVLIDEKYFPHPRTGYEYEIAEVNRCIKSGLNESKLVPHSGTREVMLVIDEIKRQIDLSFPNEEV